MSWVAALLERAGASAPRWAAFLQAAPREETLSTARLRLVPVTAQMLAAELEGDPALGKLVRARVTAEWPPEHWDGPMLRFMVQQMEQTQDAPGWLRYVVLRDAVGWGRTLIGAVGAFPREAGDVEIAYSTLPEFQRCGYATEAVRAFVEYLLGREGVLSVSAQATMATPESMKVMERCGMSLAGVGDEDGTVRYRRLR